MCIQATREDWPMRDLRDGLPQLDIKVWGPSAWRWLHVVAWTYPVEPTHADRVHMIDFLHCYARSIPCPKCRTHFSRMLRRDLERGAESPILESRRSFTAATVGWHNRVNRRLKKTEIDYATVERMYTGPPVRRSSLPLWLILATSMAVLYWYRYKRPQKKVQSVHRAPVYWYAGRRRSS